MIVIKSTLKTFDSKSIHKEKNHIYVKCGGTLTHNPNLVGKALLEVIYRKPYIKKHVQYRKAFAVLNMGTLLLH